MRFWTFLIVALIGMPPHMALAQDTPDDKGQNRPDIHMTATEWPPYMASDLPNQGFLAHLIVSTFADAGYDLKVDFSAWQRSLATAYDSKKYVGTIIVFPNNNREENCHLSVKVGHSVLGFVQRRDTPIVWDTLMDLTGVRIGSVSGYANTVEFDRLAAEQILDVSAVSTDLLNLRRVAFGRIELAVIDKYNMKYLVASDQRLASYRDKLEFNPKPLAHMDMHLCLTRTDEGKQLRDAFDDAFDPASAQAFTAEALSRYDR